MGQAGASSSAVSAAMTSTNTSCFQYGAMTTSVLWSCNVSTDSTSITASTSVTLTNIEASGTTYIPTSSMIGKTKILFHACFQGKLTTLRWLAQEISSVGSSIRTHPMFEKLDVPDA
jgi:hypothetical protein